MTRFRMCAGLGTALLLAGSLSAADPPARDSDRKEPRPAQRDYSPGFFGFPSWDSRSGGYDRSQRRDDKKVDDNRNRPGTDRRPDDRRGGQSDRGSGGPSPGRDDRRGGPPDRRPGAGGGPPGQPGPGPGVSRGGSSSASGTRIPPARSFEREDRSSRHRAPSRDARPSARSRNPRPTPAAKPEERRGRSGSGSTARVRGRSGDWRSASRRGFSARGPNFRRGDSHRKHARGPDRRGPSFSRGRHHGGHHAFARGRGHGRAFARGGPAPWRHGHGSRSAWGRGVCPGRNRPSREGSRAGHHPGSER